MADSALPLPDYDHLPTGAIESRARTLQLEGVRALIEHEQAHANRIQVLQSLQHRLDTLERGEAEPSGGDPAAYAPEAGGPAESTEKASPQTQGPPINPPSQGDPTNPAQPRK